MHNSLIEHNTKLPIAQPFDLAGDGGEGGRSGRTIAMTKTIIMTMIMTMIMIMMMIIMMMMIIIIIIVIIIIINNLIKIDYTGSNYPLVVGEEGFWRNRCRV